jgi:hypothetical protein
VAHPLDPEALNDCATEGPIRIVDVHLHGGLGQAVAREPLAAYLQVDGVLADHRGIGASPGLAPDRPQQDRPGAEIPQLQLHVTVVLGAEPQGALAAQHQPAPLGFAPDQRTSPSAKQGLIAGPQAAPYASSSMPSRMAIRQSEAHDAHQIILTRRVRQQLRELPPILQGYVTGITAVLRVDPTTASAAIQIRQVDDDAWTATFGAGRGFLTYWVIHSQRAVVLLDWTWAG